MKRMFDLNQTTDNLSAVTFGQSHTRKFSTVYGDTSPNTSMPLHSMVII
jgi:hypothetical protein